MSWFWFREVIPLSYCISIKDENDWWPLISVQRITVKIKNLCSRFYAIMCKTSGDIDMWSSGECLETKNWHILSVKWYADLMSSYRIKSRSTASARLSPYVHWLGHTDKNTLRLVITQPWERTQTDGQTYGLSRLVTHTDVHTLCATCTRMRAPLAPPIFHPYEKPPQQKIIRVPWIFQKT